MNIFFTGAISGGRAHQPNYARITKALDAYGTVHSRHVDDGDLSQYGETRLSASDIRTREIAALERSDVVVAEVSTPSLGVGYLIAHAVLLNKKVVALLADEDTLKLSAIIKGDANVAVYAYKTDADVERVLAEVFAN